jgi:NADH:ubiquinone oxidoreductase subunit E
MVLGPGSIPGPDELRCDLEPSEIVICMGSSCFSRGNNANLQVVREYIAEKGLDCDVKISGSRCEGKCMNGPNIIINGTLFQDVDAGSIIDILNHELGREG